MAADADLDTLRAALANAVTALKAAEVPFAIAGGYALYAFGAPEPDHDADLIVEHRNLDAAVRALAETGFEIDRPQEDWLVKAWWSVDGSRAFVDVIYELAGQPVDTDLLRTARTTLVHAVHAPVLPPQQVITAKLQVLSEHHCDFTPLLQAVRAVREQLDWRLLRRETSDNPYAQGFLDLMERLALANGRRPR